MAENAVYTGLTVIYSGRMDDRLVIVPRKALDDLCALAQRAAEELTFIYGCDEAYVLPDALRGAASECTVRRVAEPVSVEVAG